MKLTKYGAEQKKKWNKGRLKWAIRYYKVKNFWEGLVDKGTTKEITLKMDSDVFNHLWYSHINPASGVDTSHHANNVVTKIMGAFYNNESEVFLEQRYEDSIDLK